MTKTETTPSLERAHEQFEKYNYTDFELITKMTQWAMDHGKDCPGCTLEGILLYAANRIAELSPHLPESIKGD